jgi:hypothetical protein
MLLGQGVIKSLCRLDDKRSVENGKIPSDRISS